MLIWKSGVSVADLLQIQEKLAEAQAELDSEATQRKILANETEKVFVGDYGISLRTANDRPRGAFAAVGVSAAVLWVCVGRQPRRSDYGCGGDPLRVADRDQSGLVVVLMRVGSAVAGADAGC